MIETEDNNSVESEITVKFVENRFIPTNDESKVSLQESNSPGSIAQTNKSTVKENRREIVKKILSYNLSKDLTKYLRSYEKYPVDEVAKCYWKTPTDNELIDYYYENDYMWSDDETNNSFTESSINLIDDSPIEQ
ncbi:1420_t:CDS:2 [Dentiscutata erythropus]|uniref:1420_t:CDS:1 n=1 Tax=Dentiscutata erythropus TaxID=1348616 RepID=A0A9N9G9B8_9GLOM|nr:1420_t:CDS:2 [Dentiscutata erythropus]